MRSRSKRTKSRGFDENLNLANTAYDMHLARSPKSVKSQKSLKSIKTVLSARSVKSNRKRSQSKSRKKSKKRSVSEDSDDICERLHNPQKAHRHVHKASSKSQRRKSLHRKEKELQKQYR